MIDIQPFHGFRVFVLLPRIVIRGYSDLTPWGFHEVKQNPAPGRSSCPGFTSGNISMRKAKIKPFSDLLLPRFPEHHLPVKHIQHHFRLRKYFAQQHLLAQLVQHLFLDDPLHRWDAMPQRTQYQPF